MVKYYDFQTPNNVGTAATDAVFLLKSSLSKLLGVLSSVARLILQKGLSLTKHQAGYMF